MPMRAIWLVLFLALPLGAEAVDDSQILFEKMLSIAQKGNPEAQYHVGMMLNNGYGVEKDPHQALQWFTKSANAGDPLGAYKLGCYYGGQYNVVPKDAGKSLKYKLIAAKAGYALAQHDVGIDYFRNQQFDKAIYWWKLAAKQGFPMSLYNLSIIYWEGKVVPKDNTLAYAYFKLSQLAAYGRVNENAQNALNNIKKNMLPKEVQNAEDIVKHWNAKPSPLTVKASSGLNEAQRLIRSYDKP